MPNRVAMRFTFLLTLIFAVCIPAIHAQELGSLSLQSQLTAKYRTFLDLRKDFLSFAATLNKGENSLDTEIAMDFANLGSETGDRIESVLDLLEIYDAITCKADRPAIKLIIEQKFSKHAKMLDYDVNRANTNLGFAKLPAIATSGTKMKDELRLLKGLFSSVKLKP